MLGSGNLALSLWQIILLVFPLWFFHVVFFISKYYYFALTLLLFVLRVLFPYCTFRAFSSLAFCVASSPTARLGAIIGRAGASRTPGAIFYYVQVNKKFFEF